MNPESNATVLPGSAHAVGVGVPADPVFALEHPHVVRRGEQPGCAEARDPGPDYGDALAPNPHRTRPNLTSRVRPFDR